MGVFLLALALTAIVPEFKTQNNALIPSHSADDDEFVGGFGVKEATVDESEVIRPQAYSLLEEDEGADVADVEDGIPKAADPTAEVHAAKGHVSVMKNSGLGHMIGTNDAIKVVPHDLAKKVQEENAQIAELKGLLDLAKAEHEQIMKKFDDRKKAQSELLQELSHTYEGRLNAEKAEHDEHIASVKKEAALKAKSVRNQMERDLDSKRQEREKSLESKKDELNQQLNHLREEIETQCIRVVEADKKAETVYAENRAEWKRKHDEEIQAHGVKGEIAELTRKLEAEKSRYEEEVSREKSLKAKIKDVEREKLLMAARLKNLHNHEETLRDTEQKFDAENAELKHQIEELALTQTESATDINRAKQEAQQTAMIEAKEAQENAAKEVRDFESNLLQTTQAEISKLKEELRTQTIHQKKAETDILQQEHNVQAEMKEAKDALEHAQREAEITQRQIDNELIQAEASARFVVDQARQKAAAIRETARSSGYKNGQELAQTLLQVQTKTSDALQAKEDEIKKMDTEFKEAMDRQIRQHERDLAARTEAERTEMTTSLQAEYAKKIQDKKREIETALAQRQHDYIAERTRAQQEEQQLAQLEKQNAELGREVERLKTDLKFQKQQLDKQEIEAPVY